MKSILIVLGSGLLATTMAVAQDAPSADPSPDSQTSRTRQMSSSVIRGCLSGSAGNYTVTDQNGTQYTIAGPDNQLAARVGHEIEVTTHQDQTSESTAQGDQTTARSSNNVQVSDVRDIASNCKAGNSTTAPPMNENGVSPKGAASTSEPPQTMTMLQEPSAPNTAAQEQKPGTTPPQQTTPPVTSQTPATSASPTGTDQQTGSIPAATTATPGSNASQPATTSPAADPNTAAPTAATPSSNTQAPPAAADDASKPLYERPATDIPWANHSSDNKGSANPPH